MTETFWDELVEPSEADAAGLQEPEAEPASTPGGMARTKKPRGSRPVAVLASVVNGRTCFYFGEGD